MKIHDSTRLSTLIEKINPQIDTKASSNSLESFNPEKWFQRQWWSFERMVERAKKRGWTSLETAYDHCPLVFIIIVVISTHEIVRDDVARYPPRVQGRLCIRVRTDACIFESTGGLWHFRGRSIRFRTVGSVGNGNGGQMVYITKILSRWMLASKWLYLSSSDRYIYIYIFFIPVSIVALHQ